MSFENVFRKAFERLNQPGRTSKNLWLNSFEGFRSHFVKTMIFETSKNSQETSKNTQETSEKNTRIRPLFFRTKKLDICIIFSKMFEIRLRNSTFEIRRSEFDVRSCQVYMSEPRAAEPVLRGGWSASSLLSGIRAMDQDCLNAIKRELPDDPQELQQLQEANVFLCRSI